MITNAPWTFVVVFLAIFVVLLVFAVVWLMSQRPSARDVVPRDRPSQSTHRVRR
jgi:hypothetical protein